MTWNLQRKHVLLVGLSAIVIGAAFTIILTHRLPLFGSRLSGASPECQSIAHRLEPNTYNQLDSLSCTFGEPKPIANSSLTAREYTYSIRTSKSQCDGIDPGFDPTCYTRGGIITSDNQLYPGLDNTYPFTPGQYDYCATEEFQLWGKRSITPSSSDLYMYQGKLYQRYAYVNASLNLPYGRCTLNGTALINGDRDVVTNVTVSYQPARSSDAVTNCEATTLNQNYADWAECINFMAAASERLDICANDYQQLPDYTSGLTITGFRTIDKVYHEAGVNSSCREAYTQRMAALQKCAVISDKDLQKTCTTYVGMPEDGYNPYKIHRVFAAL